MNSQELKDSVEERRSPEQSDANSNRTRGRSLPEWCTFAIALFLVGTVIGLVIYDGLTQPADPPILSITSEGLIREEYGQFYVPFRIVNRGGETASSVRISAKLLEKGEIRESGNQQIDFLSRGETKEGAFIFSLDPRKSDLILRVTGYQIP
jgi:uncharacterized protein (TIGR02588 family)